MQVMSNHGRIWRSKFFQNVETSKLNEFDIPDVDFLKLYTHECTKSRKLDFNHLHSSKLSNCGLFRDKKFRKFLLYVSIVNLFYYLPIKKFK